MFSRSAASGRVILLRGRFFYLWRLMLHGRSFKARQTVGLGYQHVFVSRAELVADAEVRQQIVHQIRYARDVGELVHLVLNQAQ
jgi:hypothetical protein